jgi:hypothetical protein
MRGQQTNQLGLGSPHFPEAFAVGLDFGDEDPPNNRVLLVCADCAGAAAPIQ